MENASHPIPQEAMSTGSTGRYLPFDCALALLDCKLPSMNGEPGHTPLQRFA